MISFLNKRNLPGVIAMIDFEKCFDRINHDSIKKVFSYFGFGPNFVKMVMLLFTRIELCTISNGYLSNILQKERGINQGCPCSPLIYTYCGEILNHVIAQNNKIQGVPIPLLRNVLTQFADDTGAFLKYDQITLNEFGKSLSCIEAQMGLKVSYEKTTLYRVGSLCNSDATLYTAKNFQWSNKPVDTLGVTLSCDGSLDISNFDDVIMKMRKVCNLWINRKLTLTGRVLVANSLIGSLTVYKMMTLDNVVEEQLTIMENIIKEYIWLGKRPKISMYTLYKKYEHGGLRLVNVRAKQKALKTNWIFNYEATDALIQNCMYQNLCPVLRQNVWRSNLNVKDVKRFFNNSAFWSQVLWAWCEINAPQTVESKEDVLQQFLWWNSMIRIKGRPVMWQDWAERNILVIGDIVKGNGMCKSNEELNVDWLRLRGIWEAIPKEWKTILGNEIAGSAKPFLYDTLSKSKKTSRVVYDLLIDDPAVLIKYLNRWRDDEGINLERERYQKAFLRNRMATKIARYKDFQYRLLLHKIVVNKNLKEWGLIESDRCTFCQRDCETVTHLLWDCEIVKPILKRFEYVCNCTLENINWNIEVYILHDVVDSVNHIINFINVHLKQYLYRHRCNKRTPTRIGWCKDITIEYESHLFEAKRNLNTEKIRKRWSPII